MFSTTLRHRSSFKDLVPVLSSSRGLQLRESSLTDHDIAIRLPLDSSPGCQNLTNLSKKACVLKLLLLSPADTTDEEMTRTLSRIKKLLHLRITRGSKVCLSGIGNDESCVNVAVLFLLTERTETSSAVAAAPTSTITGGGGRDIHDNDANTITTSNNPHHQHHHHDPEHDILSGQQAYARLMTALFNTKIPPPPPSSSSSPSPSSFLNHLNQDLSMIPILPLPSLASFENILQAYAKNFLSLNVSNRKTIEKISPEFTTTRLCRGGNSSNSSSCSSSKHPRGMGIKNHRQSGECNRTYSQLQQRQQLQLRLLSLCSTAAPLSERTTLAVARVFSSFRELANAAITFNARMKKKDIKPGYMHGVRGIADAEADADAEAAEKWNRLKGMLDESGNGRGEEIVTQMVEFWQEEWVAE